LNGAGLKLYMLPALSAAETLEDRLTAEREQMLLDLENREAIRDEAKWLRDHQPEPIPSQKAESQLEQLANREAQRRGLEVKRRKILPAIDNEGLAYHRARVEMEVSGREMGLYQWLDRLHNPNELRAVTMLQMYPKRDDDTQIECKVTVEQWFVPQS